MNKWRKIIEKRKDRAQALFDQELREEEENTSFDPFNIGYIFTPKRNKNFNPVGKTNPRPRKRWENKDTHATD